MKLTRKSYPSDVSDEEWGFCAVYLKLMKEDAPQRDYPLREVFNGLRWFVRAGCPWRMMPNDLPPWFVVFQQTHRWLKAGCFEAMAHDLRAVLRMALDRNEEPSAVILDSRTLQSTPESGGRAGFDGHKKRKGSKVHAAVDTLGHLLALHVTPANEQDRAQVGELAQAVQSVTEQNVEVAFVDQGYTGQEPAEAAADEGIRLEVVKHHEASMDSCCCLGAGSWNDPLAGRLAFGAWPEITSAWRQHSQVTIGWSLPCSCSKVYSDKVNNRL